MCPNTFYEHLNRIVNHFSHLVPKLLQKDCFSHMAYYLQNQWKWAVTNLMKNFLLWGGEQTLKKSEL